MNLNALKISRFISLFLLNFCDYHIKNNNSSVPLCLIENEKEAEFVDFSSNLTGLDKSTIHWMKIILISVISISIILLIIFIIIIILTSSNSGNNLEVIGEINCEYDIKTSSESINILGEDYTKQSKFDIYIDNIKNKFS